MFKHSNLIFCKYPKFTNQVTNSKFIFWESVNYTGWLRILPLVNKFLCREIFLCLRTALIFTISFILDLFSLMIGFGLSAKTSPCKINFLQFSKLNTFKNFYYNLVKFTLIHEDFLFLANLCNSRNYWMSNSKFTLIFNI